ncbi:YbaB/EbfC family nucleoid-associated protein [Nocardia miyunensis]|uniref:YbaB/EbfC family nucleoid-associated protein n=1 Tax=Nocardia miyunensis TaxID=282684 RepID=UPI00082D1C82|nr:YbaB/EbfC family nucleoid-associated protein [Nocardia miyunensis]
MANEFAKAQLAEVRTAFREQMALIADLQVRRAQLTATGTARGRRVSVTVNAEGTVIETKFNGNVSDLSYAEIARAMTAAAQEAAAELARKSRELNAPLREMRGRFPKVHEIVEGMPDLTAHLPEPPEISLAPPNSSERLDGAAPRDSFENAEQLPRRSDNGVTESGWSSTKSSAAQSASATDPGNTAPRTPPESRPRSPGFAEMEELAPDPRGGVTESGW